MATRAAVASGGTEWDGDLTAGVGGEGQHGAEGGVGLAVTQLPPAAHPSALKRGRRKVISRGGHYIVWSKGGGSPWSSTTYDSSSSGSVARNVQREYSWHPPGDRVGDGGLQGYVGPQGRSRGAAIARKKLNQSFKREIAQYAMVYGVKQAAVHYEQAVGRRLRDRVVAKFVRRYQDRKKRKRRRRRRRLG